MHQPDHETYEQSLARARELIADAQRIADDIVARAQAHAAIIVTDAVRSAQEARAQARRALQAVIENL